MGEVPDYVRPEFVLMPEPAVARVRIRERTGAMLAAGWIDEVRRLRAAGLFAAPTARQALGYRQIAHFLDGGGDSRAALTEVIVRATCQYAKRQRTWFRHQHPRGMAIPVPPDAAPELLADEILACFRELPAAGG